MSDQLWLKDRLQAFIYYYLIVMMIFFVGGLTHRDNISWPLLALLGGLCGDMHWIWVSHIQSMCTNPLCCLCYYNHGFYFWLCAWCRECVTPGSAGEGERGVSWTEPRHSSVHWTIFPALFFWGLVFPWGQGCVVWGWNAAEECSWSVQGRTTETA